MYEEAQEKSCPRVVICGLRGGSGKTIATLGLTGALRQRGLSVAPFKKGPDYIDPQWISLAANSPCRNLDLFLMSQDEIRHSILQYGSVSDIAVIEGNRGLYDGMDEEGTYSTAELAIQIEAPVILVVDCTKATRTIAALVLGCKLLNPKTPLRGVILNQVASERQESVIRRAVEQDTGIPVLGSIRKKRNFSFPERHLGLYPPSEQGSPQGILQQITEWFEDSVDVEAIINIAQSAPQIKCDERHIEAKKKRNDKEQIRIGLIRDEAFHFYYPENIEILEKGNAEIVEINSMKDKCLPEIDGLYIGGGFPEVYGNQLSENRVFRQNLYDEINSGLPVLAECGGLIYLSKAVVYQGCTYDMAGVFPVTYNISTKPQGHGYTIVRVDQENPFCSVGTLMSGHEFRYSQVTENEYDMADAVFEMKRGYGFDGTKDGLIFKNCVASFCHHHAAGNPELLMGLLRLAQERKLNLIESKPGS